MNSAFKLGFGGLIASLGLLPISCPGWERDTEPLWSDGAVALHLQLGDGPVYSDGSSPNATALAALRLWNPAMSRIQFTGISGSSAGIGAGNGINNVFFSSSVYGQPFDPDVIGVTLVYSSAGRRGECDVVINQRQTWNSYRGNLQPGAIDLRRVLAHEFGHVLGLAHPDANVQQGLVLMSPIVTFQDTPQPDDLNGAAALYGLGAGLPGTKPPETAQLYGGGSVEEGQPAFLAVSVFADSPWVTRWYRDGVLLPAATSTQLKFAASQVSDSGTYTVTIVNSAGSITSLPVRLDVLPPKAPTVSALGFRQADVTAGFGFRLARPDVTGSAPLSFIWRRDGTVVGEGIVTHGAIVPDFTLTNSTFNDAGLYTLTVTNRVGMATSLPYTVVVKPPSAPNFTVQPASAAFEPGESFSLSALVTGTPPLSIQWKKDGTIIKTENGVGAPANPGLSTGIHVAAVSAADAGDYTVTVTNAQGTAESQRARVSLVGLRPPRITTQPIGLEVRSYDGFSLDPVTTGSEPLRYQWFKDGVALIGEVAPQLRRSLISPNDAGRYTVTVSNAAGSVTSDPAEVSIPDAGLLRPKIAAGSAVVTARLNQSFDPSSCFFVFLPYSSVQWRKDGVDIPGRTGVSFQFTNLQFGDSGTYTLVVTNSFGSTVSEPLRLSVTSSNPVILAHPPAIVESEYGFYASIQIKLAPGSGATVRWLRDGVPYGSSTSLESLSFSFATPAINGIYRAEVTTASGQKELSEPVRVSVRPLRPPSLAGRLPNKSVDLGREILLGVDTRDAVTPSYQWRKNGLPIPGAIGRILRIAPAQASDAGTYSVALANQAGVTLSNNAQIDVYAVESSPTIAVHPASTALALGQIKFIQVKLHPASLNSSISYRWYKDGTLLANPPGAEPQNSTTNDTLFLTGASSAPGRYSVTVSSSTGSVTSDTALVSLLPGEGAPVFLRQPAAQTVTLGSHVAFNVYAEGAPSLSYQWFKNGTPITNETFSTLSLPAVSATSAGLYSVTATNSFGVATSETVRLAVGDTGRLLGLSARAVTRGGDAGVLIAGFVVRGYSPKRLLIRGIGPALSGFGVADSVPDPALKIFDATARLRNSVDDWKQYRSTDELVAATRRTGVFALAENSKDAALIVTLEPGAYTAQVTSVSLPRPSVALVEIYDLDASEPRLVSLSTRARTEPNQGVLVVGFAVESGAPKRLLIRATGPALKTFGVADTLNDPVLKLYRGDTVIRENDNWSNNSNEAAQISTAGNASGTFALELGSKDSALLVTLEPGSYTAQVSGAGESAGVALVEVYEVP